MKAAILFDSAEEDSAANHPEICGQEIYLYALKTFYIHNEIDCIFYLCEFADTLSHVSGHISAWRKGHGIDKPVTVLHGIRHLMQLWLYILQAEQERPDMYIFHDVRFPLVSEDMITDTVEMAGKYGISMISGNVESQLYQIDEEKIEVLKDTRYLRYPVAVKSDSHVLHCLDEPRRILEDFFYYEPYLCECSGENIRVYSRQDRETAEAIIQSRDMGIQVMERQRGTEMRRMELPGSLTGVRGQRENTVIESGVR